MTSLILIIYKVFTNVNVYNYGIYIKKKLTVKLTRQLFDF